MNQGEFIVMGIGAIILLANGVTAWAVLTGKAAKRELGPQPFAVSMVDSKDKPLSVGGHDAICGPLHQRVGVLESDVRAIRLKMEADKREIITAGEDRMHEINLRLNQLATEIANAPAKTVAMLKDTKGLL
jgi:hypothetical protein